VVTNGVTRCDLTADTMGKEDLDLAAPKARSEIVAAVWVAASGSQQAGRWLRERVVGCSRRLAFGGAGVQWSRAESELASYRERHGCAERQVEDLRVSSSRVFGFGWGLLWLSL
jgi:hypothetical protein